MTINNEIYDTRGDSWWDADGDASLVSLRYLNNPLKADYIEGIVAARLSEGLRSVSLLDVGCGGGYLSEALAKKGLRVMGIDPSGRSIRSARLHAASQHLSIRYLQGGGEALPFATCSFDTVCCCDVLEHVVDYRPLIAEITRVLRPGGLFFFETINRNLISWLVMIKALQEWSATAFLAPDLHEWSAFIKPRELGSTMETNGLAVVEIKGLSPGMNFFAHYCSLRQRAKGRLGWPELARRLDLRISNNRSCNYIGYAVKGDMSSAPSG